MLYKHQQDIVSDDPKRTGLFLGTGSGKTLTALCLARGETLVACPKTQKEDRNWERERDENKLKVSLSTISKETFRRDHAKLPRYKTLIIDEAHTFLGVTPNVRWRNKQPIPKTSQLFEALEAYIARTKPDRIYLCSATIIKSPMTVWGAARLLGVHIDWYKFRDFYYFKLPMPGREVWVPKKDKVIKDCLAKLVKQIGYVGRLEDWFDVPAQTYKTIHVELTADQKSRIKDMTLEYPNPLTRCGKVHQIENGVLNEDEFNEGESFDNAKIEKIVDLAVEFPRMIVFAKYRAQIKAIGKAIKDRKVYFLTGSTKNRGELMNEIKAADEYVFIVQAQISAGWEIPECPVVVFASRTYSFVDYDQGQGRIQRAKNIKKNLYINLVVKGGVDEAVDKSLLNKQDFSETLYARE